MPARFAKAQELAELVRPHVPTMLEALTDIIKNGKDESARAEAADVLWDFYGTELGRSFAPKRCRAG